MSSSTAASIDAYIAAQPDTARPVLEKLRRVIGKAIPEADEAISYGMPAYKLGGRVVLYFAGWKQHTALYPASAQTFAAFKKEVDGYATSQGTLQFPLGEPLPVKLIEAIAKYRAAEVAKLIAGRAAASKKAKEAPADKKR
jgi:uncharacterized protein YdhG (YjbR/CyaY superfamily)